jgi:hypothetical protein
MDLRWLDGPLVYALAVTVALIVTAAFPPRWMR